MTEKEVVGIRRVRRESTVLNADRVMKLLEDKDLVADCTVDRDRTSMRTPCSPPTSKGDHR